MIFRLGHQVLAMPKSTPVDQDQDPVPIYQVPRIVWPSEDQDQPLLLLPPVRLTREFHTIVQRNNLW